MSRIGYRATSNCVRVHRARRMRHALRVTAAVVALSAAAARKATAQAYPTYPTYPTYPATPTQPVPYPGYPTVPTMPVSPVLPTQPIALPNYRPPVISLAQPTDGVLLYDDKPVAILRFATAEPLDPIDGMSLQVLVDGTDRTALFTLSQNEAWGRLSPADELLASGQHDVRARICSTRGACTVTRATVTVVATSSLLQQLSANGSASSKSQTPSRTTRVMGAVLQAMRVLIK